MASTVGGAFTRFRTDIVDLDPELTKTARSSRDYLIDQLKSLAGNNAGFPRLSGPIRHYGSFARRTKIQPLDDIDLLMNLSGTGLSVKQSPNDQYTYWLHIDDSAANLAAYPDEQGYVNSTKILNAIKSYLGKVPSYSKAEIHKNAQAISLKLTTRPWNFDIVPSVAVAVAGSDDNISHFLIPNGSGDWIRTDPRKDDERTTQCNTQHGGLFLPTVRLLKYWNRRMHKPRLPSYYFETIAIQTFSNVQAIADLPAAIRYFFDYGTAPLWSSCPDPKGLRPALDADIDRDTKSKVASAMSEAAKKAAEAITQDGRGRPKEAIVLWGQVFGSSFPTYG